MRKWISAFTLFIVVAFSSATFADEFITTPDSVIGVGLTKREAMEEANSLLADAIEDYEDSLPTGEEVVSVLTTHDWDGINYEITFQIIIDDGN